jgi:catechol 2,3-dioxygenase-like lactoylglutathione lyase family enzyme
MFGRFLELTIATPDIAASVAFYERLGFRHLITNDAWTHRYGVLSDGRIHIGLHERAMPSPAATFVRPGLAAARPRLRAAQFEPEFERIGEAQLHELRLRDPGGQPVMLLEARTYSPGLPADGAESVCGYFLHLSLPQTDFVRAREFWERGGFVALPELDEPYLHLPLTSDGLNLGFHDRRLAPTPLLVFECNDPVRQQAALDSRALLPAKELPRGMDAARGVLLEAPEGTLLWSLPSRV